MPRARRPQAPSVRSDGEATPGNLSAPGGGQPNGRQPRAAVTKTLASAGVGGRMPYGMGGQLAQDAQQTPLPPGVTPEADSARQALAAHFQAHPVTPLFSPTQRPWEPVTAGAPLDSGPTNPMAMPMGQAPETNAVQALSQAADASGSPTLRLLAQRAQQAMGQGAPS